MWKAPSRGVGQSMPLVSGSVGTRCPPAPLWEGSAAPRRGEERAGTAQPLQVARSGPRRCFLIASPLPHSLPPTKP